MTLIYDLRKDEGMHQSNLQHDGPKRGIKKIFGRFLSSEWWQAFDTGKIAVNTMDGVIAAYLDPPKSSWPEVVVARQDDFREQFPAEANEPADFKQYMVGRRIRIDYIFLEHDASALNPRFTRLVTRVEIETDCESGPRE
jgi:hypothetical protein